MTNEEQDKKETAVLESVVFLIPDCCRLGLPSCKHVAKEQKKKKTNVGF